VSTYDISEVYYIGGFGEFGEYGSETGLGIRLCSRVFRHLSETGF